MYGDFDSYSSTSDWKVDDNCQKIYQGHSQIPVKPLVISTWQSIYDKGEEFFDQFDFVIGDEAHGFDAESLKSIMEKLVNCDYRIGTTGTLKDESAKVHRLVLQGLFGMVKKIISTKTLMDRNEVAKLEIKTLVLKYPEDIRKEVCGSGYQQEMEYICSCPMRNEFLRKFTISLKGNTLLLFTFVEKHGKILHDLIANSVTDGRKVYFIYGDTEVAEREKIRKIVEKENDAIIVASYKIFSTGSSIRNLHNVILSFGTKSRVRVLQTLGRALRLGDNKESATAYDIVDDFRYNGKINSSVKHYMERIAMYISEQFPHTAIKVRLDDEKQED
jgi:superfamily II DNA or RNA helicase